jgi:hypothetical protein
MNAGDEYFVQALFIARSKFKVQETLGGGCHTTIDKI